MKQLGWRQSPGRARTGWELCVILLGFVLPWARPAPATAPALEMRSVRLQPANLQIAIEWSGADGALHALQASADLLRWETVLVQSSHGGLSRAAESLPAAPSGSRFYRVVEQPRTLTLSAPRVAPGQLIQLTRAVFDPAAPTWVGFRPIFYSLKSSAVDDQ